MERSDLETLIQQFLEGGISPEDRARLDAEVARSSEARTLLDQYRVLFSTEALAAARHYQASPELSVKVMDAITKTSVRSNSWRLIMQPRAMLYVTSLGAAAFALFLVQREGADYRDYLPAPEAQTAPVREEGNAPTAAPGATEGSKPSQGPAAAEPPKKFSEAAGPVRAEPLLKSDDGSRTASDDEARSTDGFIKEKAPAATKQPTRTVERREGLALRDGLEGNIDDDNRLFPSKREREAPLAPAPIPAPAPPSLNRNFAGSASVAAEGQAGLALRSDDERAVRGGATAPVPRGKSYDRPERQSDFHALETRQGDRKHRRSSIVVIDPERRGGSYSPPPPPARLETEDYGHYEENERVKVSAEPVSTFGIDVDTGSYTNLRRFLSTGKLPPKDAVRIEELLNYFSYDYPKQTEEPFAVYYEAAPAPLEKNRTLLKLGIRARDLEPAAAPPRSLVFLVDVSGSMADANKLPLLKQALHVLVDELREQDRLALVTYADGAQVVLRPTAGSARTEIHEAVERLQAGGSTNGSAGIDLAFGLAQESRNEEGPTSVILATDGDFNVGNYSFEGLMSLIEEKRKSGISLNTIGLGSGNLKERNLEQLADRGNGSYYYLDSFNEARDVLTKKLGRLVDTIARDVKLQVEFNPSVVREYRLIGYDNRKLARSDFSDDSIDSGEIGAGHTVTAIYELTLTDGQRSDDELRYGKATEAVEVSPEHSRELAFVKIRFKKPGDVQSQKIEYPILREKMLTDAANASADFRFAAAVMYFGEFLRGSKYLQAISLKNVADLAKSGVGEDRDGARAEFQRLVEQVSWMRYGNR